MFYSLLFALCFLGSFLARGAEEQITTVSKRPLHILSQVCNWSHAFAPYVAIDPGVRHFASLPFEPRTEFTHFEESELCSVFSQLRCATCFAMTINTRVDENIFTKVLDACHDSEIYQVFVAADSYYKGRGNSKKFQKLKHRLPEELTTKLALFSKKSLLAETARKHQSSIFERNFTWLQQWEDSREKLSDFFESDIIPPTTDIFESLMQLCAKYPYALHHLGMPDCQKYAYVLVPMLLKGDNFSTFSHKMRSSFAGDPQKEELCSLLNDLKPLLSLVSSPQPHNLQTRCASLVHILWTLWESVNAHVTQEQWSHCVTYLRQSLPWMDEAFKDNHPWLISVFAYKKLPQKAVSSTSFDYYTQHHAPLIFGVHAQILKDLYPQLEQYCTPDEQKACKHWIWLAKRLDMSPAFSLCSRHRSLEKFHTLRCCILWKLAKEDPLPQSFCALYCMCSHAEKRALYLNAQRANCADNIGQKLFKSVTLPDSIKDLSRIGISASLHKEC